MFRNIKIIGKDNCILYEGNLYKLPIAESIVVQKSIEYFNDPEPCFLHKSAVIKRLYYEIQDFFEEKYNNGIREIKSDEFPSILQSIIDGNAKSVYLLNSL